MADVTTAESQQSGQIRNSALLMAGLVLAAAVDFVAQVLLVRYLSKGEFGAWSYALAMVALLSAVAQLEMGNTVARFIPMYLEHREPERVRGTIVSAILIVVALAVLLAISVVAAIFLFDFRPVSDATALRLLVMVAVLIPVQAADALLTGLFAAFGESRTIFLRHSIAGPAIRLGTVILLIAVGADVEFLALGYVSASVALLALYANALRPRLGPIAGIRLRDARAWTFPGKELMRFALPLMTSTIIWTLMESADAVMIGYFIGAEAVGSYRLVVPLARMNLFAYWAFTVLFTPNAARAFARSDDAELSSMYWQTAAWMTMLTLPILLMTFSFANVLVPTVYGSQYGSSAAILAILSTAYFINTAFGFNGLTVRVFHKLRWVVGVDLSMAALNIIANIILIPRFGPVGAACGTAMTVVIHTILRHVGLKRYTGVPVFSRKYAGLYLTIGFLAPCLFIIQLAIGLSLPGALILAGIGTLIAFTINRRSLRLDVLFPELARLPFLRRLTGAN